MAMTRGNGPKVQPVNPAPKPIPDVAASLSCDLGHGIGSDAQPAQVDSTALGKTSMTLTRETGRSSKTGLTSAAKTDDGSDLVSQCRTNGICP